MRKQISRLGVMVLVIFGFAAAAPAAGRVEHVFLICLDGAKPSVVMQSDMPVLKKLVAEGAHTWEARTVNPSLTLPAFTSMLTGVLPDKHKITWNDWQPAKGVVGVPTVFGEAKKAGFTSGMFVGKFKFLTLVQPGTVEKFSYDKASAVDVTKTMDGVDKEMTEGTVLSKVVAADAAKYIREKKPNFSFIHFTDTDDTGHNFGWGSAQQMKAFADEDAGIGVVLQAIREAGILERSVIIITSDHGGHAKTHGSRSLADMIVPYIVWGKGVKKGFEITEPVNVCDITPTALWLLGAPPLAGIEGKALTSAFE